MKGFLTGCLFVAIGYWLTSHDIHVFTGRYRQPVFSYGFIACGTVVILVSAAPAWLIIKMTAIKKYRPYQQGSHVPLH
ncbi:MAG: hypothetical protein ACXWBH_13760 [Candidatus Angelobacter sp.]